jgi:16S rRNA (adenine1518-N6/adenine1519-N6)-dimethyltransferase
MTAGKWMLDSKGTRLYPSKRLGQHFLSDKNIIDKIVKAADISAGERVLEIGPGTGALTGALLDAGAYVTAIEIDSKLSGLLQERFSGVERFALHTGDVLKFSFPDLSRDPGASFKVVSNLPYNISAPLLFKFIEEREALTGLVVMLQKEVAERICSGPGTKNYGILSVLLSLYYDASREFDVSRNCFSPPPKVDSTVLSFSRLAVPRVEVCDYGFFLGVVKSAFGRRRKMLLNSLTSLGLDKEAVKEALSSAAIDPKRRAETLDLIEFSRLASALYSRRGRA